MKQKKISNIWIDFWKLICNKYSQLQKKIWGPWVICGCILFLIFGTGLMLGIGISKLIHDHMVFPVNTDSMIEEESRFIIVLDSGHGVKDSGAEGIVRESEITAKTTNYLQGLFEENPSVQVIRTNEKKSDPTVAERRELAQDYNADFFISIHCNSNQNSSELSGFEIYPQVPENPFYDVSYGIAQLIMQGFIDAGHKPRIESGIFYARFEKQEGEESILYSLTEEEERIYDFGGETFGVIKSEKYPGILIEQGYVHSLEDVEQWMSDEGCQKAAQIYYDAICTYFEL